MNYFYSICLLLGGMGLPLFGKTTTTSSEQSSATFSSKTGDKGSSLAPATKSKETAKANVRRTSTPDAERSLAQERPVGSPILGERVASFSSSSDAKPSDKSSPTVRETVMKTPDGITHTFTIAAHDNENLTSYDDVSRIGNGDSSHSNESEVSRTIVTQAVVPVSHPAAPEASHTTVSETNHTVTEAGHTTVAETSRTTVSETTHTATASSGTSHTTTVAEVSHTSEVSHASVSTFDRTSEVSRSSEEESHSFGNHNRLARVTAYWSSEGDYYTGRGISSTGVHLHDGHCAVDPNIIPYGSIVEIPGLGRYLAVDTGSAVVDRTAAREGGHTSAERGAIVIDVYFDNARDGERFESNAAKFATITWWTPRTADSMAQARSLFAAENWTKIQSKQL